MNEVIKVIIYFKNGKHIALCEESYGSSEITVTDDMGLVTVNSKLQGGKKAYQDIFVKENIAGYTVVRRGEL